MKRFTRWPIARVQLVCYTAAELGGLVAVIAAVAFQWEPAELLGMVVCYAVAHSLNTHARLDRVERRLRSVEGRVVVVRKWLPAAGAPVREVDK